MSTTTATARRNRRRFEHPILPPPCVAPPIADALDTNWLGAHFLFSVWEAARFLGTSEAAVRDYLDAGQLVITAGPAYAGIPVWQLEALQREIQQG